MNQAEIRRRQFQAVSMILTLFALAAAGRITGFNGAAYIAAAAEVLTGLWLIVGGGTADALGRLLRVRTSRSQYRNAERLRRNAMIFQMVFGAAGTLFLLLTAGRIAETVFRLRYCTFILMALSPVIFFRAVTEVFLGMFQGEGAEYPTAMSGIFRMILIFGFGLLFGRMLSAYGEKVSRLLADGNMTSMYGGVGMGIAVSVSELFVLLFVILLYRVSRRRGGRTVSEGARMEDSFVDSVRALWLGRGVQWLIRLLLFLPIPLGFVFLQKSGLGEEATVDYGVYGAVYWVLVGICTVGILICLIPVYGRTAYFLRREEHRFAKTAFQSGVHFGGVYGIYASAFLTVMAPQLAGAFCEEKADVAEKMLRGGGFGVLLLTLSLFFARFLSITGGKTVVLAAAGAADVVYVISCTVLLNSGKAGILSLVYAGILGMGVLCILLGAISYRQLRARPDWLQILLLPAVTGAVASLICMLIGKALTPHLGNLVTLLAALVVSVSLYLSALLLLHNFREQALEMVPGGRLIRALGQMLRVF